MWNLKNKINKQNKQTNRYREQIYGCQMGVELGEKYEKGEGIKIYKLPVTKTVMGM